MIQRIQSLYILIATVLLALTSRLPLINFMSNDGDYQLLAAGITQGEKTVLSTLPLLILLITATTLNSIAFFGYRKRMLQIRLLVFSTILQLGSYGLAAYYILQLKDTITAPISGLMPITFPIIASILSFLAIRSIGKDEALVKSLDRIR